MKKWIYLLVCCVVLGACQNDDEAVRPEVVFSDFQDPRDGNLYKCITVGGDTWLAENLRYYIPGGYYAGCIRYSEGWTMRSAEFDNWLEKVHKDGNMADELYTECYDLRKEGYLTEVLMGMIGYKFPKALLDEVMHYNKTYAEEYGYLYTYDALEKAVIPGWEVPTDEDWKRLEESLGMPAGELIRMDAWRGNGQAELLMKGEEGIGFNVKLGGGRVYHSDDRDGVYEGKGCKAVFWTSEILDGGEEGRLGIVRTLLMNDSRIWRGTTKQAGTAYTVRLIRRGSK